MNNRDELNKIRLNVANNMYLGTPKEYRAFEFLIAEIDRQHDEFYNVVRFADQKHEHSNYHNAKYVAELREEIVSIKKAADVIDERNQELFKQIAEKDKEIRWLREERDTLESKVQHYRGYE